LSASRNPPPPPSSRRPPTSTPKPGADDFGVIETEDDDTSVYELPTVASDDSGDFSISIDDDAEDDEVEEEGYAVEDRFGLPEESAELPLGGIKDISGEIEEI